MWQGLRAHLVGRGLGCERLEGLTATIDETHNMAGKPNEQRANWVSRAKLPFDLREKRTADVVYFVGCVTSFFPMAQPAARAFARLLAGADLDFGIAGGDEWCCGFPLMSAGASDAAAACVRHNVERMKDIGAKTVVMTCPGCYRVWKEEYLDVVDGKHGLEILHSTELLARLLEGGRIKVDGVEAAVTYHDPCDLARNSGIYEEPRYILDKLPGVELVELDENRERCACCGSGGDLLASNQDLAMEIAGRKVDEVLATGADTAVTACPSCVRAISMAKTAAKVKLGVLDISELILKSMGD
jgi:heterodisulfide reductase subunit D